MLLIFSNPTATPTSATRVVQLRAIVSSLITLRASSIMSAPTGYGSFYQGEAFVARFAVLGAPSTSGWATKLILFASSGATLLAIAGVADTPIVGTISVTLTHAQTAALASGTYRFEFHRADLGSETMLATGTLEVLPALAP